MSVAATDPRNRFWMYVEKTDGCWLWTRGTSNGYGRVSGIGRAGGHVYAHRLSWEIANGEPVPTGMHVCHSCDNPRCVNPSHLWVGTAADNARDRDSKGRGNPGRVSGEMHGNAKLTENDVMDIRARYRRRDNAGSLAREYGVTRNTIWRIANDKAWPTS